jgi:cyanophycinase
MLHNSVAATRLAAIALVVASCAPAPAPSSAPIPSTAPSASGPPNGTLVIAGGGNLAGTGIVERFLHLAGGPDAPIVVIPTADGDSAYTSAWPGLQIFRDAGATNITVLHTYDPLEADSEEFVAPLRGAAAVWFPGGRQWRLAEAYLDTRTQRELDDLLARGGVVGGSSAGASIQASFLVRGAREGNHIVMSHDYDRGFGFVSNVAIDQHLLARNRERDLLQVLAMHPYLLGIGIDEGTAIVVQGDAFEVIGRSRVAIYDRSPLTASAGYFLLTPGEWYDMSDSNRAPGARAGAGALSGSRGGTR